MKHVLKLTLAAAALCGTLSACVHDRPREEVVYRDPGGRAYRHERWHDEDVYQREDGHWYARQNDQWIVRGDVDIR